jgi:hypothetical protein
MRKKILLAFLVFLMTISIAGAWETKQDINGTGGTLSGMKSVTVDAVSKWAILDVSGVGNTFGNCAMDSGFAYCYNEDTGFSVFRYDAGNEAFVLVGHNDLMLGENNVDCDIDADTIIFTAAHRLAINDKIKITNGSGTVCGGLTSGNTYYVQAVSSTTTVKLKSSIDGSLINLTSGDASSNFSAKNMSIAGAHISGVYNDYVIYSLLSQHTPISYRYVGLGIMDVKDKSRPVFFRSVIPQSANYLKNIHDMRIVGNRMHVVSGDLGKYEIWSMATILAETSNALLAPIGTYTNLTYLGINGHGIQVDGNRVIITSYGTSGSNPNGNYIIMLDISNEASPQLIGTPYNIGFTTNSFAELDDASGGKYQYAGNFNGGGIYILDTSSSTFTVNSILFSNPSTTCQTGAGGNGGNENVGSGPDQTLVLKDYLIVAPENRGRLKVAVYDVSNKTAAVEVACLDIPESVSFVKHSDEGVFFFNGIHAYKLVMPNIKTPEARIGLIEAGKIYADRLHTQYELTANSLDVRRGISAQSLSLLTNSAGNTTVKFLNLGAGEYNLSVDGDIIAGGSLRAQSTSAVGGDFIGYDWFTATSGSDNGSIKLGSTSAYQGILTYDGGVGVLYFSNTYNSDSGDIRFYTKGKSVLALNIAGSGLVSVQGAAVGGVLYSHASTSDHKTVGVAAQEDILMTFTVPANTLNVNGKGIEFRAWGSTGSGATYGTKTVKCYWGGKTSGTVITSFNASSAQAKWSVDSVILREGASAQQIMTNNGRFDDAPYVATYSATSAQDDTGEIVIECTGAHSAGPVAAGGVIQNGLVVEVLN